MRKPTLRLSLRLRPRLPLRLLAGWLARSLAPDKLARATTVAATAALRLGACESAAGRKMGLLAPASQATTGDEEMAELTKRAVRSAHCGWPSGKPATISGRRPVKQVQTSRVLFSTERLLASFNWPKQNRSAHSDFTPLAAVCFLRSLSLSPVTHNGAALFRRGQFGFRLNQAYFKVQT